MKVRCHIVDGPVYLPDRWVVVSAVIKWWHVNEETKKGWVTHIYEKAGFQLRYLRTMPYVRLP